MKFDKYFLFLLFFVCGLAGFSSYGAELGGQESDQDSEIGAMLPEMLKEKRYGELDQIRELLQDCDYKDAELSIEIAKIPPKFKKLKVFLTDQANKAVVGTKDVINALEKSGIGAENEVERCRIIDETAKSKGFIQNYLSVFSSMNPLSWLFTKSPDTKTKITPKANADENKADQEEPEDKEEKIIKERVDSEVVIEDDESDLEVNEKQKKPDSGKIQEKI